MLKKFASILLFTLSIFFSLNGKLFAQRDTIIQDTVKVSELKKHSPTKASLFSAVVPGLGQAYNKKYWKIPIIYAGMGVFTYYALQENDYYAEKKDAYLDRINGDSTDRFMTPGNFYNNEALLESTKIHKRNRDLMIILDAVVYILQIVDASVDAHLFYFNVSDDLSLHYKPHFLYDERTGKATGSLTLNLYF